MVPQDAQQQQQQSYSIQDGNNDEFGGVLTGEVLSILRSSNNGGAAFAVVKVCEEDLAPNNNAYAVANAMAAAAATETDDDVTKEDEEGEKVELASALFGKPMPQAVKKAAAANSKNGGVVGAYTEYLCAFFCGLFIIDLHTCSILLYSSSHLSFFFITFLPDNIINSF